MPEPGTLFENLVPGTATAGVAVARTENGIGLAGVAGGNGQPGSGVRYMPVAHFTVLASGQDLLFASSVARGIDYASRTGADVITMSFGSSAALATDGTTFVVGDYAEDEPFRSAGAAYIGTSRFVTSEPSTEGSAAALSPPWPNPTAGPVRLMLDVPTPQRVEVAVYDVLGRRLAVLYDAVLPAAAHDLALGHALAPGVYVVRARGETFTAAQRLTVTR